MSPVAVTGMHRTGSSMVAKTLRLGGLYLGADDELLEPAPDNPGGFFEHAGFVQLDEDLLQATGGSWDHPPQCGPMAADDPRVAAFQVSARDLVTTLAGAESWGWKDPRTSLTIRFWLDLIPDLRVVVCVRHPLEVALSLKRRNQVSYTLGLSLWHTYFATLLDAVPEDRRLVTHYAAYFRDADAEVQRILRFAGLPPDAIAGARCGFDRGLRHHRLDTTLAAAGAAPETIDLYRRLCAEAGESSDDDGAPARAMQVDRSALDLELARAHLAERDRQILSLERERGELADRVAALETATEHGADIAGVARRLDGLEDAFHDLRYQLDGLTTRSDAPMVRACRNLVRAEVPRGAPLLVIAKGDPALLDLHGHPTSNLPQDGSGQYPGFPLGDSSSAIAHLEARRLRGDRFLLIPTAAQWWIEHFASFAEHLASRYRVVRDDADAGMLVDISTRRPAADSWPRAPSAVIDRIATISGREPAILDWTDVGMASRLRGRNVFACPADAGGLPYLDATIDAVLIDDQARLEEARRVARVAVLSLQDDGDGLPVTAAVERVSDGDPNSATRIVLVVGSQQPDPTWLAQLREAIGEEPSTEIVVSAGPAGARAAAREADIVGIIDDGVLPLPGCCTAARTSLAEGVAERVGGVAVKLFAADGSLEAAGATVFADGSWAGVAAGSYEASAPWHDYVRETCWGPGLAFFAATALEKVECDDGRADCLQSRCAARLWAAGFRVLYQPDATAVRGLPGRGDVAHVDAEVAGAWEPALASRPSPVDAADGPAWRELLTRDDVRASWG